MATTAMEFRELLSGDRTLVGIWSLLSGVSTASLIASSAPDYVVFDLQHGALSEADLPAVTAVVRGAGAVPLVRTRSAESPDIGRALDLGAEGVIVPSILSADHARKVLSSTRYGPVGTRSIGRVVGSHADPVRILMVETRGAFEEVEEIAALDCDAVYVGPSDLAMAFGDEVGGASTRRRCEHVVKTCLELGTPVGVHSQATPQLREYASWGARLVNAAVDAAVLGLEISGLVSVARTLESEQHKFKEAALDAGHDVYDK